MKYFLFLVVGLSTIYGFSQDLVKQIKLENKKGKVFRNFFDDDGVLNLEFEKNNYRKSTIYKYGNDDLEIRDVLTSKRKDYECRFNEKGEICSFEKVLEFKFNYSDRERREYSSSSFGFKEVIYNTKNEVLCDERNEILPLRRKQSYIDFYKENMYYNLLKIDRSEALSNGIYLYSRNINSNEYNFLKLDTPYDYQSDYFFLSKVNENFLFYKKVTFKKEGKTVINYRIDSYDIKGVYTKNNKFDISLDNRGVEPITKFSSTKILPVNNVPNNNWMNNSIFYDNKESSYFVIGKLVLNKNLSSGFYIKKISKDGKLLWSDEKILFSNEEKNKFLLDQSISFTFKTYDDKVIVALDKIRKHKYCKVFVYNNKNGRIKNNLSFRSNFNGKEAVSYFMSHSESFRRNDNYIISEYKNIKSLGDNLIINFDTLIGYASNNFFKSYIDNLRDKREELNLISSVNKNGIFLLQANNKKKVKIKRLPIWKPFYLYRLRTFKELK